VLDTKFCRRWKRYETQMPDHHVQIDVNFTEPIGRLGPKKHCETRRGDAPSEGATESDRVEPQMLGLVGVRFMGVRAARDPSELEHEGLAVSARPFRDDIGNDATIVGGTQLKRLVNRVGQVDAVHPKVA
jgi:hypothetical protein